MNATMSRLISFAARSTSTPLTSGIRMSESSRSNGSRSQNARAPSRPSVGDQHLVAVAAQHDAQHLAHRRLVVNDENARPWPDPAASRCRPRQTSRLRWTPAHTRAPPAATGVALRRLRRRLRRSHRQPHADGRAGADGRRHLDRAAVVGDDAVNDGQAEPGALVERAAERLEELVELVGRNAAALVLDRDDQLIAGRSSGSVFADSSRRPPDGIARSPFVARFQRICRIWFSSASYQTGSAGTSTSTT